MHSTSARGSMSGWRLQPGAPGAQRGSDKGTIRLTWRPGRGAQRGGQVAPVHQVLAHSMPPHLWPHVGGWVAGGRAVGGGRASGRAGAQLGVKFMAWFKDCSRMSQPTHQAPVPISFPPPRAGRSCRAAITRSASGPADHVVAPLPDNQAIGVVQPPTAGGDVESGAIGLHCTMAAKWSETSCWVGDCSQQGPAQEALAPC